jgi:hypothetical protein
MLSRAKSMDLARGEILGEVALRNPWEVLRAAETVVADLIQQQREWEDEAIELRAKLGYEES